MADELDTASAVQQYLRGPDVATQARASLTQAAGTSGALEAELRAVSARTGVPISTARAMPQEVKRRAAAADDYEDLTRRFPNTMGFLANAANARLAHDDRDNLTALERVMQEGSFIGRALASSMPALSEGIGGVAQAALENTAPLLDDMVSKILPANPLRAVAAEINKTRQQAAALTKGVAGELPPDAGNFRRGVQSGFQSLGSQAPAIVASVLTRDPRYMLGSAGISEGGKSYGAARDKGMSPLGSAIYGGSQAFVEVATESLPALALLKDLKVGSSLFKTILHQAAAEIPGEQLATLAQDYNEWLFLNPDKPFKSYLDARPDAAIQTLVATVVATGAQAAIGHTAAKMAGTMGKPEEAPGPSLVQRIVETANNSELRKRDPNAFASLVQQTADANGAPAEVFIDARQVSEALQQSGITLEQAVAAMPSLADQLEAATVMGGDVVIPIGEFAAGIAGSPIEPLLMQHVRTEADGLSQADGKKKTAADQQMAGTAKKAEEQAANLTPLEKEREKVKQDILEQLNATKRFTPDIHEAQAELTATVLSNIARRAGKTVEQLFNGKPLKVQASGVFADALQQVNLEAGSGFRSLAVGQTTIDYSVSGNGQTAEISMVKTPKSDRGQGAARAAMKQFLAGADAKGVTVFLTAEPMDKGVSKSRLQAFYKSLGFKPNTGRNADYRARAGMVRRPQGVPHDQTKTPEFKRFSQDAPLVSRADAQTRQFKSGEKIVVEAYHGTKRPDRVGTKFLKKRATSGPMAFHTSSPELASSYAAGKQDTSLASEDQDYSNWFKVKIPGDRSTTDLVRSWYRLDSATKDRIAELAPRVMFSDEQEADGGNKIEPGPEGHDSGTGSYDYNLASTRTTWDRRGNPLKALIEDWLNSGNLFDDEQRFMQVLKLAGFPMELVEYDSPTSEYPFVYKNYIAMYKPLVTSDVPQEVVEALNAAAKKDRSRAQPSGADSWDKNTRTLREWVAAFNSEDNTYVWTSIPDKVTDVFKSLGYDGIVDWSGKGGGPAALVAPVYIPFEETQIKSAIGNKGTFDSTKNDILKQDAPAKPSPGHIEAMKREKVLNRLLECLSG